MNFDIVILSHKKDYNKLPFLINSVRENIHGFGDIHVISPEEITDKISGVLYYTDDEALPLNDETKKLWTEWSNSGVFTRQSPNWIKQQFIKLFQIVTKKDYLIIDSDIILIKKLEVISNGKPNLFLGRNQYNYEYFTFMKNILSLDKEIDRSFICELMFFKKDIIHNILSDFDGDYNNFIKKSISLINNNCFISEFELYGNYTMKNFPTYYQFKNLNCSLNGKHSEWRDNEIFENVEKYKNSEYDLISLHSWC
jgi:hypothetical protein